MVQTRYAPFLKRFVAFLIDSVLSVGAARVLVVPFDFLFSPWRPFDGLPGPLHHHWHMFNWLPLHAPVWFWGGSEQLLGLSGMAMFILYFSVFESSWRQATPGKMMLGLFVTDEAGRRLSFPQALARVLSKFLSTVCCFLGFIMALFTARSQALHDLISGSLVLEPQLKRPPDVARS